MTIDRDAERTYVYVSSLLQRSDKNANVEYNRIQSLPYGSELITYQKKEMDGHTLKLMRKGICIIPIIP